MKNFLIYVGIVDGFGVYGSFFHYAMIIAFVGSALLIFLYLWRKERLDMDEEPKWQMMKQNREESYDRTRPPGA